jgi:3'-5' exoribonuclease
MTIAELTEDRVVEGVYAVRMKRKLRTKSGASYLALELVDSTGKIEARVWKDVELLDGRFAEGDAVRVLARVERFRDRLQLDVRSLEASDVDPATLTPSLRRDKEEIAGFLEFLVAEVSHPGLAMTVQNVLADRELSAYPAAPEGHHSYAGGLLEHTVGVATLCRETAQLHPRLRLDLLLAAALVHDVGRTLELGGGPAFAPTDEGKLLGHVHLGTRLVEQRAEGLSRGQLAELVHCVAVHHDARGARTAEAAVLYHANQLDAIAATRPVD